MSTLILGIDPGGKTGVAVYNIRTLEVDYRDEVSGGTEGFAAWFKESKAEQFEDIVCESFQLDDRTAKPDLTPVEIIGHLKSLDAVTKFQTPAQAKSLITNAVLKRAGLYPPYGQVKGGHSTDALRHALYYVVTTLKHRPTLELLWPRD